jgi:hypothetical protein
VVNGVFDFYIQNINTRCSIGISFTDFFKDFSFIASNFENFSLISESEKVFCYDNAGYYSNLGTIYGGGWEEYHSDTFQNILSIYKRAIKEILGLDLDMLYPVE